MASRTFRARSVEFVEPRGPTARGRMVLMRAFERFVRWNVSDNVKVAVCVSVIMAMSVAPHVGACYAVCAAGPAPASNT